MPEALDPDCDGLDGRTAIVTGGAGNIGAGITLDLVRHGASVVVAQRSRERPERLVERIDELGGTARFVPTDLAVDDDIVSLVDATEAEFGGVDIVVNNATHPGKAHAESISRELWEEVLAVTLTGPFRLAQEAYPSMRENGYGRIINVGAIQAEMPMIGSVAYVAAKAGMEGLTRSLAVEWGDEDADITANTIRVGPVPHGEWEANVPIEETNDRREPGIDDDSWTLIGRLGRPSDIAGLATFLASPRSSFITGETIRADGGRLLSRKGTKESLV
jgi:NAD(P)-dependent dehydrogenase (short-subunit alcohol dehydrogenase family)